MKQLLSILALLMIATVAVAQTQQGIVKTKGRLNADGTVTRGTLLQGATVRVKGRQAVVSAADGSFSFPTAGGNYTLDMVKKNGYQLVDPEMLSRQYAFSAANPLMVVMETPEQQADDALANERKIRRNLQRQLMQREDEIEQLREENRIGQEEYRRLLQELYAQQQTSEKLIKKMVDYYSQIDYDQLDDFNRQISTCILNGDLARADSLLSSKGDINSRIAALRQHQAANADEAQELARRQASLQQSQALARKELDDLAQDCYHKYEICKMQFSNDSAAYYLQARADLDSLNIAWQLEAGKFIEYYIADYHRATAIYQRTLRNAIAHEGENSLAAADCYDAIGGILFSYREYAQALQNCQKALEIRHDVLGQQHHDVIESIAHIGLIYNYLDNIEQATAYCEQALKLLNEGGEGNVSAIYGYLGDIYTNADRFAEAHEYYQKQLDMVLDTNGENSLHAARAYNSLGVSYSKTGDLDSALKCCYKALEIFKTVTADPNHAELSMVYNNIAIFYAYQNRLDVALENFELAYDIVVATFGENSPSAAAKLANLGSLYQLMADYDKSLECFNRALMITMNVFGENCRDVAFLYNNISIVWADKGDFDKALEYSAKAVAICQSLFGERHTATATVLRGMGQALAKKLDFDNALKCLNQAFEIHLELKGGNSYDTMGDIAALYDAYLWAIENGQKEKEYEQFIAEIAFTATVEGQEYVLLQCGDWNMDSYSNVNELMALPEAATLIVIKDGQPAAIEVENLQQQVEIAFKHVGKLEKKKISEAYRNWKNR